jgi:hypothetical protein
MNAVDAAHKIIELFLLYMRGYHLDALFLIQVYLGSKFCPSVLETLRLRVPTRHLRLSSVLCLPCN